MCPPSPPTPPLATALRIGYVLINYLFLLRFAPAKMTAHKSRVLICLVLLCIVRLESYSLLPMCANCISIYSLGGITLFVNSFFNFDFLGFSFLLYLPFCLCTERKIQKDWSFLANLFLIMLSMGVDKFILFMA